MCASICNNSSLRSEECEKEIVQAWEELVGGRHGNCAEKTLADGILKIENNFKRKQEIEKDALLHTLMNSENLKDICYKQLFYETRKSKRIG